MSTINGIALLCVVQTRSNPVFSSLSSIFQSVRKHVLITGFCVRVVSCYAGDLFNWNKRNWARRMLVQIITCRHQTQDYHSSQSRRFLSGAINAHVVLQKTSIEDKRRLLQLLEQLSLWSEKLRVRCLLFNSLGSLQSKSASTTDLTLSFDAAIILGPQHSTCRYHGQNRMIRARLHIGLKI